MGDDRIVVQYDPPAFFVAFAVRRFKALPCLEGVRYVVANGLCLPGGGNAAYKKIIAEIGYSAHIQN
jgi:hypothetical protein